MIARRAIRHLSALLAALLAAAPAVCSDSDGLTARARLAPPEIPFHRSAVFTIEVESPPDLAHEPPALPASIASLETRRREPLTVALPGGRIRTTYSWSIDPVRPGDFVLAPPVIAWEGGEARLAPLALRVRDLTDAERAVAEEFAGLIAPEALPPAPGGVPWWAALAAAAAAALAGWLLYRRLSRVPVAPAPLPAWEVAARRLRELAQRRLPEQGRHEAYYVDLSAILRYYLEDRFALHAPEQTTQEFLETASQGGALGPEHQAFLAGFLRHSDRVKFARHVPAAPEMAEHFAGVEAFVRDTTPRAGADPAPTGAPGEAAA